MKRKVDITMMINSKVRREKKKIIFKGLKYRKIPSYITGRIHGKNKLILESEEGFTSPWIRGKIKQFEENSANMWGYTAMSLYLLNDELENKKEVFFQLNEKFNKLLSVEAYSGKNAIKRRVEEKKRQEIKKLREEINEKKEEILKLEKTRAYYELETKEVLCEGKRRVEKIISAYLKGASRHIKLTEFPTVDFDSLSNYLYQEARDLDVKGESIC